MSTDTMKQTVIKNPTWWRRRTSMERSLTMIATVAILVSLSLIIALAGVLFVYKAKTSLESVPNSAEALSGNEKWNPDIVINADGGVKFKPKTYDEELCLTTGCVHTASEILKNMDPKIDPCDDFYEFACGNFIKNTNIPDDKTSVSEFSAVDDKLQEQLRTMIEEPIKETDPKPFVLAKDLYKSCMNKTLIESRGLTPLFDILKGMGGWPVLEGSMWNEEDFTWIQSVYKFRKFGYSVDYFFDFSIGIDLKNSTVRKIDLDQASLGLRREYLTKGFNDKLVSAYYNYMVDIAVKLGADRDRATRELKESLEFEIALANISLPNEKRRNATLLYNPYTLKELQVLFSYVPWVEYINTILPKSVRVDENEIVIVYVPSYFQNLEVLLKSTPKRVLANYVMWRATSASISYLTEDVRKRQLDYSAILNGQTQRESRWKECIDIVSSSLSISVGALYVRKYFNEDSKKEALEMVTGIREEFAKILQEVEWMDDVTRSNALDKAASMQTHIAYPDELLDNNKLIEFYNGLEITRDLYLESILNLTLFGTEFSFRRLREPVNKTSWISHSRPAIVNAFYSSVENSIQFPAGILQGKFFGNDRPRYMNYGGIGFVIGHEITHGFDDQGRQFDKNGNLVDWWAEDTKQAFIKKSQCIIDQYGNFTDPEVGLNLNGVNTQGENIADNGGIKEAYLAYNRWAEQHGPERQLPGLNYSPQQMFWISAANTWCSKYRPETMKIRITTGYHSPGRFRVIGPFTNSDYFANDFNCPKGSKMNSVDKCKVW